MASSLVKILSRVFVGQKALKKRMYQGAKYDRLNANWVTASTSQDSETLTSLRILRDRSRQLIRDNEYAAAMVRLVQQNVVGPSGIKLQMQIKLKNGKLNENLNAAVESEWERWCEKQSLHTAGQLNMPALLRVGMAQLVETGECIVRKVPKKFGNSHVPLSLEVIESDRLVDQFSFGLSDRGNSVKMGVEVDSWGRPVSYYFYSAHPGDYNFAQFIPNRYQNISAQEILHVFA